MAESSKQSNRTRRRFSVDALFEDTRPQASGVTDLTSAKEIELGRIDADPEQPRRTIDEDRLEELTASIRTEGVLQPIVVRYDDAADRYVIVHGERRWRASQQAGRTSIPALVKEVPRDRILVQQLMENIVRDDLNAVDRSTALRALRVQLGDVPWEDVASAVGIKRSRLFQLLGTEKLPEPAREDIRSGRLSEKQSRVLQGLPQAKQEALREVIVNDELPAQTATRLARAFRNAPLADETDVGEARASLESLRQLTVVDSPDAQRRQTAAILDALQQSSPAAASDDTPIAELNALLATPKVNTERLTRDIGQMMRTLARLSTTPDTLTPELETQLHALRSALTTILNETSTAACHSEPVEES